MLESFAAAFLNKFLGSYVENFDPKQLQVGIWNGDVKLKNLKLRKEALDELDLPVNVKAGILGDLTMQVPWSNLKNKPVKISINNVFLLCEPRTFDSYDPDEDVKRELRLKLNKLDEMETMNSVTPNKEEDKAANESFTSNLVNKIVDNVQITVKNIHFRYEDFNNVFSEKPCSAGFSLHELSAMSTNEDWVPSFISITQQVTQKLISLDSLSIYFNTDSNETVFDEDLDVLVGKFQESIQIEDDSSNSLFLQNLISPVTGSCKLSVNKAGSTEDQPHIDAILDFSSLSFELDDTQYQEMLSIVSKFQWFQRSWKFRKSRPAHSVAENPKEWFKYTAQCVLDEIHEKNYKRSWEYIKERSAKKKQYVDLWKVKLAAGDITVPLNDKEKEDELTELTKNLTFEDLKFFRALAKKEYSTEKMEASTLLEQNASSNGQNKETAAQKGGWFSSWWAAPATDSSAHEDLIISDEQKEEFYDAIEWNENDSILEAIDVPEDRVILRIHNALGKGSLKLKMKNSNTTLGEMIFEDCQTSIAQRPNSFAVDFKLFQFTIEDGSPDTLNKHIVKVNNGNSVEKTPFFNFGFETNPLNSDADSALKLKLNSMSIYYHVHFINSVIQFFKPPREHYDTLTALLSVAESTVEGWTHQTRMGLEALLEDHKNVDINCDLQTPLIIVPLDPHSWETPCLIIDAGHISVTSELIPKAKLSELKKMSVEEYSKIDPSKVDRLMFDRFKVSFDDAQLLIGPDIRSTISSLGYADKRNNYAVLEKTHLNLTVDVSIFPKALNLPKVRTKAYLPSLKMYLNDYQYKIMMQLLETSMPTSYVIEDNTLVEQELDVKDEMQARLKNTVAELSKMSKEELNQKLFQLNLIVDSIELGLEKCMNKESMLAEPVISIAGKGFDMQLSTYTKDLTVVLGLTELNLTELSSNIQKDLISSTRTEKTLFEVNLTRSLRIVPYNNTLIEVYDQDINMNMSSLKVSLNSKAILFILNYMMTTFTDMDNNSMPTDVLRHNDDAEETAPQKMNIVLKMDEIISVLEDDTGELATLSLSEGSINCYILPEKMKITGRLGKLELRDELHKDFDSYVRNLVSMQGDDVAEFSYETFDQLVNQDLFDSQFDFSASSVKINFVEQSFGRLFEYMNNFQQMKVIYDNAREAAFNQAPSIDNINNVKLNVLIKTPIVEFPTVLDPIDGVIDNMTFYLGEFYLNNEFEKLGEATKNKIHTGWRSVKVTSLFNLHDGVQRLNMVDDLTMSFDINSSDVITKTSASFNVIGNLSEVKLSLTELQLQYLDSLSSKISAIFERDGDSEDLEQVEREAIKANAIIAPVSNHSKEQEVVAVNTGDSDDVGTVDPNSLKVDLVFTAPEFILSLFDETSSSVDVSQKCFTKISLLDSGVKFKMKNDGGFDGSAFFSCFTIEDTRQNKQNKHAYLIPKITSDKPQFMATFDKTILKTKEVMNVSVVLENIRVILAVDYLIHLQLYIDHCTQSFANTKNSVGSTQKTKSVLAEAGEAPSDVVNTTEMKTNFAFDVVNPTIVLLANPEEENSEAIVFKIGRVLFAQQDTLNLSLSSVGFFMCNIGSFDKEHVRLIDDFAISLFYDDQNTSGNKLSTSINLNVDKLIMRVALRDIRLAMKIFNKAVSMGTASGLLGGTVSTLENEEGGIKFSREFKLALARYAPSCLSSSSSFKDVNNSDQKYEVSQTEKTMRDEKFVSTFGGLRLVFIGDVSELPLLDLNVDPFSFEATNWSTNIDLSGNFTSYVNVFNYSKSDWEPLIESTPVTFKVKKGDSLEKASYNVHVNSKALSEITLSSEAVALLSKIPKSIYNFEDKHSRGDIKPYKIINETGSDLAIWINKLSGDRERSTVLKNGECLPWEFEDWRQVRENLDTDNMNSTLGFEVPGSYYDNWFKVNTKSESDELYRLEPPVDGVHDRIRCHIFLDVDGVKIIKFQSPLIITNQTGSRIEVNVSSTNPVVINPASSVSIPFDAIYESDYAVRPLIENEEYNFPKSTFSWKDILDGPIYEFCGSKSNSSSFYFQIDAKYNQREKLARVYPHMEIVISAPFQIENFLPVDMEFELVSKNNKQKYNDRLEKGQSLPIHFIDINDFVFLKVYPVGTEYVCNDYVLIASPNSSALAIEKEIKLRNRNNRSVLKLGIKYSMNKETKTMCLKIYAPYIVLNRTECDLFIREKNKDNVFTSKTILKNGENMCEPEMFSFDNFENQNSAQIKMKETDWSLANTFDALEQNFEMVLPIPNKTMQTELGLHISEGLGKFKLSKLVTISPRFIVQNEYEEDLVLSETMSISEVVLKKDVNIPLYKMSTSSNKLCKLKFYGGSYSEPFLIGDIGISYVKIFNKRLNKNKLLRIDTVLDKATLFVSIRDSQNEWPYSVRNFTNETFLVYQRDPYILDSDASYYADVDNDGAAFESPRNMRKAKYQGTGGNKFEPIVYKILPYTLMPFSWDYPSAKEKKLVIESRGTKRTIDLKEIGNLKPFMLKKTAQDNSESYVELNILADGPVQALVLSKYNPDVSLYKLKGSSSRKSIDSQSSLPSSASKNDSTVFDVSSDLEEDRKAGSVKVVVKLEGFGISICNKKSDELVYARVKGVELRYNDSKMYQSISWKVKWVQVDNQLFGSMFPNVIYPSVIHNVQEELDNHPFFSGSVTKVNDETRGLTYYKYATSLLQEVTIKLDEEFIVELLNFFKESQSGAGIAQSKAWNNNAEELSTDSSSTQDVCFFENYDREDQYLKLPENNITVKNNDIYFETLHLQPTIIHLSFMRSDRLQMEGEQGLLGTGAAISSNGNDEGYIDMYSNESDGQNSSNTLINILTMTLGNVNDAPIKLNSVMLENLKGSSAMLLGLLQEHYNGEFFRQLLKVVGYADVLGNPIGLFNNISSGVFDIFYTPYQGYFMNDRPEELGVSIAKGGISFVKKSVFGVSDSVSKFTGSIAKGLTAATQDRDFQKERLLQQRKNRLNQDSSGLANGMTSLFKGISSGITGVATNTLEGAKKEGAGGFFKGLGKGIVGVPTKAAIGFLDLANNVSAEIRNNTNIVNGGQIHSIRFPRYVNRGCGSAYLSQDDGLIQPYNLREAQGQYWLKMCNGGQFIRDHYIAHVVLPGKERILCVSEEHVCEIDITKMLCISSVSIEEMCTVGAPIDDGRQIIIKIKNKYTKEVLCWKFPVPRAESRKYIMARIIVAQNKALKYMDDTL